MVRGAFTLIELIFAIVIIAISVISLPMMSQTVAKGVEANVVQEAIFAAATELNEAVTAHWDENSIEPGMPDSSARVIETVINRCENDANLSTFRQMSGHINQPLHRRCLDANTTVTTPSDNTVTAVNSLDDMAHPSANLFIDTTNNSTGYKETYKTQLSVTRTNVIFGTDQANANPDMKRIDSTVTDKDLNTISLLITYSANIGEVDFYKRSY